jgi:serine/threonine protein kinase
MSNVSACPNPSLFERPGRDGLGEAEKQALLEHLEGCPACADRVSALPCDDTLVELIRQADTLGRQPAAADGQLMEKLRQLLPEEAQPESATVNVRDPEAVRSGGPKRTGQATIPYPRAADPNLCSFLAPSQQPGELGRLGPYRALEVLGSGGMGVVFRAEDTKLRRQVALKAMLPWLAFSSSSKERFLREASAAASVKHDHIVTIHQVDEAQGVPFIAMEFLEGQSLEQRLAREKKLPLADILRLGREVAEGLAAAHDLGLVHRDIKPANIWLEARPGGSWRVKILDFGLARGGDEDRRLTQKGVIIGTPAYMCPEQSAGRQTDARSDLFSLGCVLYETCTGALPFSGADVISTLVAVAAQQPKNVHDLNPALPGDLADLVMQLLEKDPEDRPQSAREVAERIAALEAGARAPVTGRLPKKKPRPRRAPILWGTAAALAFLGLGGIWLAPIILRIESAHGTVIVKSDDKDVQVRVSQGGKEIVIIDLRRNKEITLKVGKYDVELVNPKPGLRLKSDHFSLLDGDQQVVEVRFEPKDEDFKYLKPPKKWLPPKDFPGKPKKGPKGKGGFFPPPPDDEPEGKYGPKKKSPKGKDGFFPPPDDEPEGKYGPKKKGPKGKGGFRPPPEDDPEGKRGRPPDDRPPAPAAAEPLGQPSPVPRFESHLQGDTP